MKTEVRSFSSFYNAICNDELVFMFGTGISSALTGERYSWYKWIADGISNLEDSKIASQLKSELDADSSADNLISVVGKVIQAAKDDGSYSEWMHQSFETADIKNTALAETLQKLTINNDVFATTNYDLLLERAAGLKSLSYEQPNEAFEMLKSGHSDSVLHIHGIYDSVHGIDNIVADQDQYDAVLNDKGAQFIQNILGTRTLIFVGCGKTTEDVNIRQFVEFARKHLKMDRTYYFLYNATSPVEGLPDNIHLIPYGDAYSDLPEFLEDLAVERIQHRITGNCLIGRTAFETQPESHDSILKYHFSKRTIPFCGRDDEISQLTEFVKQNASFSWWAVTGQAGAGKSRLAYELIRQLPSSWFGFFVNDRARQMDAENYVPFCNTMVVIDYVAGRERLISELIDSLQRSFEKTNYKLRILLLERENNRTTGSWYEILLQRCGRAEAELLRSTEYKDAFLHLEDMDRTAVEKFISLVCASEGLGEDENRDAELYEIYRQKFERLQFRPLYLQLFVESWIVNGCETPKYDDHTDLLEDLLKREQEKWLCSVDNDQAVCNACVRLLVRANIAPIKIENMPELYKSDWELLRKYIESHSFIGKQKNELQDTLINALCQNIDNDHAIIAPQFPDVIKEFMFSYYTDAERLPEMMKEIWINASVAFYSFITRCLMDFEDQAFYKQAINAYQASTEDIDVLVGRLDMLRSRLIQKGEDPQVFWDLIDNEYAFWSAVIVPDEEKAKDYIATLKVVGLHKVAQHIGAWSSYDISAMMDVIDEMLQVQGGPGTDVMKKFLLQDTIRELSTSAFFEASEYLRGKLDDMIGDSPEDEFESLLQMQNHNDKMMGFILSDKFEKAKKTLLEMSKKCKVDDLLAARVLAHSCFNIDTLAFQLGRLNFIGTGLAIVTAVEEIHPDDWSIRARRIGCQISALHKRFFVDKVDEQFLRTALDQLDAELSTMSFRGTESDEALGMTWSAAKVLRINIASQKEIEEILRDADVVLKMNPRISEVVSARIIGTRVLHKKYLRTKITHKEVESLFQYVEKNPESESVRNEFFEMLEESEDAGKTRNFLTTNLIREALQDAKYNPLMGSGIPEIDFQTELMEDMLTVQEPYVRGGEKVGRNQPCPCGSGKKFKRCCAGKGFYD